MCGIGGLVKVCVIKDEDGAVATEFERYFFEAVRADFGDELANARTTGEGDFLDVGVAAQFLAKARSVVQICCEDIEDPGLEACFLS